MIELLDLILTAAVYLLRILGTTALCMVLALVIYAILQTMMGRK